MATGSAAVRAGGDFQATLNAAKPGDVITLQAGATFTGNTVDGTRGAMVVCVIGSRIESMPEVTAFFQAHPQCESG